MMFIAGTLIGRPAQQKIFSTSRRLVVVSRILATVVWTAISLAQDHRYAQMSLCLLAGLVRVDSYALLACWRANVDHAYTNIHGASMLLTASQIVSTLFINLLTLGGNYRDVQYAMIALSVAQLILACRWTIVNDLTLSCASTPRVESDSRRESGLGLLWGASFLEMTYNTGGLLLLGTMGLNLSLLASALIALLLIDRIEAADYSKTLPPIAWGMGCKVLIGLVLGFFPETAVIQKVFFALGCGLTTIFSVVAYYLHWIRLREPSLASATELSVWMLGTCAFGVYTRHLDPGPYFWHMVFLGMMYTGLDYELYFHRDPDETRRVWATIQHNQFQSTNVLPDPSTNPGEVIMDDDEDEDLFSDGSQ